MDKNMTSTISLPIDFVLFDRLTNVAHWIYRIWTIPFIIMGLVGNLMSLIIFMNWARYLSVYVYFSLLCIVNICILIIDVLLNHFIPYVVNSHQFFEFVLPIQCRLNF